MSPTLHLARVTIEFMSAFHLGSGEGHDGSDAGVVIDVNGLPTLPGSSIQGVLRHAFASLGHDAHEWFGYDDKEAARRGSEHQHGRKSRVDVSWGLIHDKTNRPVEGWTDFSGDEVLLDAARPMLRDHVRLDHRRTAADKGKFDELAVSAGHRFTLELKLTATDEADAEKWAELLAVLGDPLMRFGGKTRRGFGSFEVAGICTASFDLGSESDRVEFLNWPTSLRETAPGGEAPQATASLGGVDLSRKLTPDGLWMIGGGADADADSSPVKAHRIVWDGDTGRVDDEGFLIPGSSIKGALAHRTCFHANRLAGIFADREGLDFEKVTGSNNAVVAALFGSVVDHDDESGQPGRIFIDDVILPSADQLPAQNHVAIDPFTGGAKDTALFQDRPLSGGTIPVSIRLAGSWDELSPREILPGHEANPKEAFEAALEDLDRGLLGIGAHGSRGYGHMKSEPVSS